MKRVTVSLTDESYKKLKDYANTNPYYAGNLTAALREVVHVFFVKNDTLKSQKTV